MEKIINIMIGPGDKSHIYKDPGMIIYSLSRYCGWEGTHAYLNEVHHNADFEEYGKLLSTGYISDTRRQSCIKATKEFIRREIKNYDVAFFFNYGSTNYKLAYLCKKYNPNIRVYCKLDMGEGGFKHFEENSFSRKVKNYLERIKSRYVDLFTVETKHYYEKLKDTQMFAGGRIAWLPNGVSTLGIDIERLDKIDKENIVLTVGRLGTYQKNTELLLSAITKIDLTKYPDWKFYFVGPLAEGFQKIVDDFFVVHPNLKGQVIFTGSITDREKLYELYAKSKVFCFTSRWEGFSIALIEAMYFGCIPVITNYGYSVMDVTDNGKLGFVVEQENADELTEKLSYVMQKKFNYKEASDRCRQYARNNYDYQNIAKRLDEYLRNLF